MIIGGSHTAGALQTLLYQLIIPFNIANSFFLLPKSEFSLSCSSLLGALLVLCGVFVIFIPQLRDSGEEFENNELLFNLIYAISMLPASLTSVLSEKVY